MIILLINKYLFVSGGAETVLFQQWRWLEAAGHAVIPFATADPRNVATDYARFFAPGTDYDRPGDGGALSQAVRLMWSRPARRALEHLLEGLPTGIWPRVAHLHNVYHQLSPSVIAVLRAQGIPAVMTLHDYKLVCPNYRLYTEGTTCERCVGGGYVHAVVHRCVKGSRLKSAVCAAEGYVHGWMRAYAGLAWLISPSVFLRDRLVRAGWDPGRIAVIPNAVELPDVEPREGDEGYLLYAGRLAPEKGLLVLLQAVQSLPGVRLLVAGDGPLRPALEAQAARSAPGRVEFLGQVAPDEIARLLRGARCLALPSVWPENSPLAVLEALAQGVPVVATNAGGLPELITDGENGRLVPPGDAAALAAALSALMGDPAHAASLGRAGRERVQARHAPEQWLERHLELYQSAIRGQ